MDLANALRQLYTQGFGHTDTHVPGSGMAQTVTPEPVQAVAVTAPHCIRCYRLTWNAEPDEVCCRSCVNNTHGPMCDRREELRINGSRIVVNIDISGSMAPLMTEVRSGLNTFIVDQKNNGAATLLISQFDTTVDNVYNGNLDDVPVFDHTFFIPRGMTALYDAIGNAIVSSDNIVPDSNMHAQIAPCIVTFTDGEDNSSIKFTRHVIRDLIKNRSAKGWTFLFFGCSQNAVVAGEQIGIPSQNCVTYSATPESQREAFRAASDMVTRTRTSQEVLPN